MEETTYVGHTTRDLADELTEAAEQARLIRRHGFAGASFVLHPHRSLVA